MRDELDKTLRDIAMTPLNVWLESRLPVSVTHQRIGSGGAYTVVGHSAEVERELAALQSQYPHNSPYQGTVTLRTMLEGDMVVKFRYWGCD